jgi:uncharacterized protein
MTGNGLAVALSGFAQALRDKGVPANTARVLAGADALTAFAECGRDELYWALRLCLCADRTHLPVFDEVFAAWFGMAPPGTEPVETEPVQAVTVAESGEATGEDGTAHSAGTADPSGIREAGGLSPEQRAEIDGYLARLGQPWPERRSPRYVPGGRYRLDVRATVRAMCRTGGEPVRPRHRRHGVEPRRLLMLVDVSASMAEYCDGLLRFCHAAVRARPGTVEVFTLGTRFTRATAALAHADPEVAIRAVDRGGGTTLGRALLDFLRRWSGHRAVRAATIVVASDGWESGPVDLLERQIARLRLLSYRLLWLNPQAGGAGFALAAPGLRRVLPLVDGYLEGAALHDLADRIAAP